MPPATASITSVNDVLAIERCCRSASVCAGHMLLRFDVELRLDPRDDARQVQVYRAGFQQLDQSIAWQLYVRIASQPQWQPEVIRVGVHVAAQGDDGIAQPL